MIIVDISVEEFDVMTEELLNKNGASFDMLCHLAEKALGSSVKRWCNADPILCGKEYENDIMQEIYAKLIKKTVSEFLLKDGPDGPVNKDPKGFGSWMFLLAKNVKRDFSRKIKGITNRVDSIDDKADIAGDEDVYSDLISEQIELLKKAFDIVLESDSRVYIPLTWLAQSLLILYLDITKIQSNEYVLDLYKKKTLYEMRDTVYMWAERIPWLYMTEAHKQKIENSLNAPYDETRVYGEVEYGSFLMKKGGKATISDWVNRMNSLVGRVIANEALNS